MIWFEGKDKSGKNVRKLNLARNSRLCSCRFDEEQISADSYTGGDPVHFSWNNLGKLLVLGRPERHRAAEFECCPVHVPSTQTRTEHKVNTLNFNVTQTEPWAYLFQSLYMMCFCVSVIISEIIDKLIIFLSYMPWNKNVNNCALM